jgi:hypothetical protein
MTADLQISAGAVCVDCSLLELNKIHLTDDNESVEVPVRSSCFGSVEAPKIDKHQDRKSPVSNQ